MLNTPAPVAQGIPVSLNPQGAHGAAPNGADDGRAFAQALDRAAARQRDAAGDGAEQPQREHAEAKADAANAARPDAGPAKAATRAAPPQKSVAAAAAAAAAADAASAAFGEGYAATPGATLPQLSDAGIEPGRPADKDTTPTDLAAWVASLPLPRPATATATAEAAASAAAPTTFTATTTGGVQAGAAAHEIVAAAMAGRLEASAGAGQGQDGTSPSTGLAVPVSVLAASPRQAEARLARGMPQTADEVSGTGRQALPGTDAVTQAFTAQRETAAGPRAGSEVAPAAPALPGGWATALPRNADTAAVLQAELRAPVGSGEFAPALGSQLSVMVRNGIDHAQLKLNPADMGPIDVRISLDGTQAQVDFSAANAATRQALQEAVPALATALRESGLTLSGGGVFEQPREQRDDTRQDGTRQRGDTQGTTADLPAGPAPAERATRARGVVDLYA